MYINHCLIGADVSEAPILKLYNYLFSRLSIDGGMSLFQLKQVEELPILLHFLERFNFSSILIDSPYRRDIAGQLQSVDDSVSGTGCVNMIRFGDDGWRGFNTESAAFTKILDGMELYYKNSKALVIGAGAVARTVINGLALQGVKEFYLVNKDKGRAEGVQSFFDELAIRYLHYDNLKDEGNFDIVINATSADWSNSIWLNRFWADKDEFVLNSNPDLVLDCQYSAYGTGTPFLTLWGDGKYREDGASLLYATALENIKVWFELELDCTVQELRDTIR